MRNPNSKRTEDGRVSRGPFARFRPDLQVLPSKTRTGDPLYLVKDLADNRVFEFGEGEYFLCRQLDGHTDPHAICDRIEAEFEHKVGLDDMEAFIRHLEQEGLLEGSEATAQAKRSAEASSIPIGTIRFGNPEPLLAWLMGQLRWCASRPALFASLLLVMGGVYALILHGRTLVSFIDQLWSPSAIVILATVGFFCVMVPRELVRALACKYYGVPVPEIGIRFLYYIKPRVYVDVSRVRMLQNKTQRMWVFFAAGYTVLITLAIGTVGWSLTTVGSYLNTFFLTLAATSAWTVLFTWNPFLKRDAYNLIGSWLEIPRLRERAQAVANAWMWGQPLPEPLSQKELWGFRWYGLLVVGWMFGFLALVFWMIGTWWTSYYEGIGVVAFVALLIYLLYPPLAAKLKQEKAAPSQAMTTRKSQSLLRWVVRISLPGILIGLMFLPYEYTVGGPTALVPKERLPITSEVAGVIESVSVREGDRVEAGQPVVKLVQRDYRKSHDTAKASWREAEAKLELLLSGAKPEEIAKADQLVHETEVKVGYNLAFAERQQELHRKGFVPRQEYEDALRRWDSSREALKSAQANATLVKSGFRPEEISAQREEVTRRKELVRFHEEQLQETVLASPLGGWIVTPYIEEKAGIHVDPGTVIGIVENSRTMLAEVLILEADASLVRVGQEMEFRSWAYPDSPFPGHIVNIAPIAVMTIDQETSVKSETVRVMLELPNETRLLKSGMTGYAKIYVGTKSVWEGLTRRLTNWFKVEFWSWMP